MFYDLVWMLDACIGMFLKVVLTMAVLTYLCKPKEIEDDIKKNEK